MAGGKESWLEPRSDLVEAKGKGFLQTYFVNPGSKRRTSSNSFHLDDGSPLADCSTSRRIDDSEGRRSASNTKEERLVNWIVDLLHEHLKKLIAKRRPRGGQFDPVAFTPVKGQTPLEEVAEAIVLPEFCKRSFQASMNSQHIVVDPQILKQLHQYVTSLASMYHDNPFHNFGKRAHTSTTHRVRWMLNV